MYRGQRVVNVPPFWGPSSAPSHFIPSHPVPHPIRSLPHTTPPLPSQAHPPHFRLSHHPRHNISRPTPPHSTPTLSTSLVQTYLTQPDSHSRFTSSNHTHRTAPHPAHRPFPASQHATNPQFAATQFGHAHSPWSTLMCPYTSSQEHPGVIGCCLAIMLKLMMSICSLGFLSGCRGACLDSLGPILGHLRPSWAMLSCLRRCVDSGLPCFIMGHIGRCWWHLGRYWALANS